MPHRAEEICRGLGENLMRSVAEINKTVKILQR